MRAIIVVGARPNFIKVGPLMPVLDDAGIEARLVHTGQHYDALLSDVFFADLEIPEPTWYMGIGSGTHAVQTGRAMIALEELFEAERPDAVIVVGDVNSTLAGALAAVKIQIPVVHLEAGLRSGDMSMPEEVNRLVTDQLSAMLLAPTPAAGANLTREGCAGERIHFVGNIMAESLLRNLPRAASRAPHMAMGFTRGEYVVATIHRPENTDYPDRLAEIVRALERCGRDVVFPVHPRTRTRLLAAGLDCASNVRLAEPVGYLDMLALQRDAAAVITDSGGVQEEACMLRTPCVTVRRNTEREVTVEVGANRLASADAEAILSGLGHAIASSRDWEVPSRWDEAVSGRVVAALESGIVPLSS